MSRRLLSLAALVLVGALTSGCADDVSPALQVGDTKIGISAFQAEMDDWASSPTLVTQLGVPTAAGAAPGSYSTDFANAIINLRVGFEIHNAKFEALGLELPDGQVEAVRDSLFQDPQVAALVFGELDAAFADRLVADVARQSAVIEELGDGYDAWAADAFATTKVEINPRFGHWDPQAGALPPVGPLPGPAGT